MRIRGFAMGNGVSFSDGKRRVTGRILADGRWEIREGGRWYWRFSVRQVLALAGIAILGLVAYLWPAEGESWVAWIFLLALLPLLRLSPSQRRFHGAEHAAVNLWEGKAPSILHPGCGSNLVLLVLPGLLLELLPVSFWPLLACELVYLFFILKLVWPFWLRRLRMGDRLALFFWSVCGFWQRLFVSRPRVEEVNLACRVLQSLNGLMVVERIGNREGIAFATKDAKNKKDLGDDQL